MPGAVVKLIADHDRGPPEQRVERISDLYLASQDPGIMRSRRMAVPATGRSSASLISTAKLNGVEPLAWLTDVLERMVSGRAKTHRLDTLLPWAWKAAHPANT